MHRCLQKNEHIFYDIMVSRILSEHKDFGFSKSKQERLSEIASKYHDIMVKHQKTIDDLERSYINIFEKEAKPQTIPSLNLEVVDKYEINDISFFAYAKICCQYNIFVPLKDKLIRYILDNDEIIQITTELDINEPKTNIVDFSNLEVFNKLDGNSYYSRTVEPIQHKFKDVSASDPLRNCNLLLLFAQLDKLVVGGDDDFDPTYQIKLEETVLHMDHVGEAAEVTDTDSVNIFYFKFIHSMPPFLVGEYTWTIRSNALYKDIKHGIWRCTRDKKVINKRFDSDSD